MDHTQITVDILTVRVCDIDLPSVLLIGKSKFGLVFLRNGGISQDLNKEQFIKSKRFLFINYDTRLNIHSSFSI